MFLTSKVNSIPATMICPFWCSSSRLMQRIIVDLPEPEGPQMTMRSPRRTSRARWTRSWNSPYHLWTPSICTADSLLGAARVRWDEHATGPVGLPELTSRESDILSSMAQGHSIRQTARALGIAPKTVENVQTRLFRKLGVRNRSGALAVANAFGLLPPGALRPV